VQGLSQINVTIDFSQTATFNRGFEQGVGSCHAITSLRADWREQMQMTVNDLNMQRVRFHGLLDDEMSTVLPNGEYSFLNIFKSFDYLLSIGVAPLVELSFMPELYANGTATIFYYQSNTTPPKNVTKWEMLISSLATALIDRYGERTVTSWIFEVWNEPNCDFWNGTMAQYYELYLVTARALKSVNADIKVGGPVTCQLAYLDDFLAFVKAKNAPLDIVTSHLCTC
jgi:xylan 1,4-beta-xylosidase